MASATDALKTPEADLPNTPTRSSLQAPQRPAQPEMPNRTSAIASGAAGATAGRAARNPDNVSPGLPVVAATEPVGDRDAQLDLESLARCLGALLGSAMPIVRIPGGQGTGSPAEHVQAHLTRARRAMRRLAGLRETHYGHVLTLLFAYVHLGEEHRVGDWQARIRNALLPSAASKGGKSLVAASGALGCRMLLAAEDAYARAPEIASDGRWLVADLASVAELALRGPARRVRATAVEPEDRDCARCPEVVGDPCAPARRRRPKARAMTERCVGVAASAACVAMHRWRVVAGALLPSKSAQSVVVSGGAGSTWELLRDAAEAKVRG